MGDCCSLRESLLGISTSPLLPTLTHSGAQDATIKIYDVISKTCLYALSGFEGGTGSLSFSPAGFRGTHGAIAGGAWNASFRVWDVEVGLLLVMSWSERSWWAMLIP